LEADVYIGFGTVPSLANARSQLTAAVRACTSRGLRTVVTAPSEQLRRELAEIDARLVQAREFVSLPALLRSCKVVISHAGAGTVLASLASGVPVVLMPRDTPSQLRMAEACHRAGVGRRCEPDDLDAALDEVINDPAIAAAASDAARQIAELPNVSSVVPLITSLTRTSTFNNPRAIAGAEAVPPSHHTEMSA
jgi:UDP:flavonoid glycosyltransferase YjiC (YdhE family)